MKPTLTLLTALLLAPLAALHAAEFHVAPEGRDTNPGTAAAPFATLARARDAVRGKIKDGLTKDIVVEIRGGTYPVTETLTFGPEDSGTEKFSITYAAAREKRWCSAAGGRSAAGRRAPARSGRWNCRKSKPGGGTSGNCLSTAGDGSGENAQRR